MSAGRNLLLERGRRRARLLRPATLIYRGLEIPCATGNLRFFQQLQPDGNGFLNFKNQHITVLKSDLPPVDAAGNPIAWSFETGHEVDLRENETGQVFHLRIGDNNSEQPALFCINVQTQPA